MLLKVRVHFKERKNVTFSPQNHIFFISIVATNMVTALIKSGIKSEIFLEAIPINKDI